MKTVVACLGNELVSDDGIGVRIGRVLERLSLPENVDVIIRPNLGLDLIELLEAYERVVIVDAMTSGRPPGTVTLLDPAEAVTMACAPSCSHSLGIAEILHLVTHMFPDRAKRAVRIVGIEASCIDQFGVGLSEPVGAALPSAVDLVIESIDGMAPLREEAGRQAEEESRASVSLSMVLGCEDGPR